MGPVSYTHLDVYKRQVFFFPVPILSLFTNDQAVIQQAEQYLRIVCFSYFFFCITNTAICALRGVETCLLYTSFQIPLQSVFSTVVWFAIGFGIILLYDMISVAKTKPISLLSSEKAGEREPKSHWILAVIGVLALGAGYVLALTVKTPWDAFANFFTAVLCVIIGTYCLFRCV